MKTRTRILAFIVVCGGAGGLWAFQTVGMMARWPAAAQSWLTDRVGHKKWLN